MKRYRLLNPFGWLPPLAVTAGLWGVRVMALVSRSGRVGTSKKRETLSVWELISGGPGALKHLFEDAQERAQIVFDGEKGSRYYVVNAHAVNEIWNKTNSLMDEVARQEHVERSAIEAEIILLREFVKAGFTMLRDASIPHIESGEVDLAGLLSRSGGPGDKPLPQIEIGALAPLPSL